MTVERKAGDVTFLAAYTIAKALDDSSGFAELINFQNAKLSRGLSSDGRAPEFRGQLYLGRFPSIGLFHGLPKRLTERLAAAGNHPIRNRIPDPDGSIESRRPHSANAGQLCPGLLARPKLPCEGDASLAGSPSTDMPNLVGPVHIHNPRATPGKFTYFDQSAFVATNCSFTGTTPSPDCGTFGTANRRFFHGPGINNTDFGITKRIQVTEARCFRDSG